MAGDRDTLPLLGHFAYARDARTIFRCSAVAQECSGSCPVPQAGVTFSTVPQEFSHPVESLALTVEEMINVRRVLVKAEMEKFLQSKELYSSLRRGKVRMGTGDWRDWGPCVPTHSPPAQPALPTGLLLLQGQVSSLLLACVVFLLQAVSTVPNCAMLCQTVPCCAMSQGWEGSSRVPTMVPLTHLSHCPQVCL